MTECILHPPIMEPTGAIGLGFIGVHLENHFILKVPDQYALLLVPVRPLPLIPVRYRARAIR